MFLEKIKLKGFKSFSNNTKVDFEDGLSIIVGPNGSGKSNINDAIKWVLGEAKRKELRTASSTDVIFNGTKYVEAGSTAEVSLYFNNKKQKLNTDKKNVKVTRKIEKESAKSTYLIDGEKVRRKDIRDLFMGSGLGNTDLSIISQSSVTKLTEANPQEVKGILNEASGVSGFMQSKKETIRELEKVSDSKEIFEVKINQLSSRYNSLKKQSEKAVKFKVLRTELNEIELPFIYHSMLRDEERRQELSSTLEDQTKQVANYKADLKELKSSITSSEKKTNTLRSKISELELKASEAKRVTSNGNDNLEHEIKKTVTDAKVLEGELEKTNAALSVSTSERITNNHMINDLRENFDTLREHKANLEVKKRVELSQQQGWVEKGTKYVLENKKLFNGVVGLMGDIVKFEDKFSVAVTEAMGASLRNLVVDTDENAKEIIKTLRKNKLGRTTIVPYRGRKEAFEVAEVIKKELTKFDGFLGTLDELISFAKNYERLVKQQTARVLVFKDIDMAARAAKAMDYKYKVVTLEGDLILPGMVLKGGSKKQVKKSNINEEIQIASNKLVEITKEIKKIEMANIKLTEKINQSETNKIKFSEKKQYLEVILNKHLTSYQAINGHDYNFSNFKLEKEFVSAEKAEIEIAKLKGEYDAVFAKWTLSNNKEREIREQMIDIVETQSGNTIEMKEILDRINLHTDILLVDYNTNMDMLAQEQLPSIKLDDNSNKKKINKLRAEVKALGPVDVNSIVEFETVKEDYETSKAAFEEVSTTFEKLTAILEDLESRIEEKIVETFEKVNVKFAESFQLLFKGGEAKIEWVDPDNIIESGINIIVQPPGKKLSSMKLFSGGEKTMTSLALIFAMNLVQDIPLLILDEPEAALDEANVERFARFAKKVNERSQVIITTHRPGTMEQADNIFGVAMQEKGITSIISVKLAEALAMAEE